jgi:prophage regulatory protein
MRQSNSAAENGFHDARDSEFLRLPSVLRRTGLGRSTIYRLVADEKFPAPVKLSGRAIGWRQSDLERWSKELQTQAHTGSR